MDLKVVSFNIRCCDDDNGNTIEQRAPRLFTVISRYDADIINLQEYRPQWEPYISKQYGEDFDMFYQYRNLTKDIETTPILWRKDKFDCVKTGCFWLSDTPEVESNGWDEIGCYRICVYVILKEKNSNKEFTVMNTHFGFGDQCHTKSINLLSDYSQKISCFPTFITGDFNLTPDSSAYAAMTGKFRDVNACTVNDLSTTFHNYTPERVTDQHIDYCFIDQNIIPIHQKIIKDTVEGKFPSDHYGLYVRLEL